MTSFIKSLIPVSVKNAVKRALKRPHRLVSMDEVNATWARWLKPFNDNPFDIKQAGDTPRETYLRLAQEAANRTYPEFMAQVRETYGKLPDKVWIDELARSTQVVNKSTQLLYVHGYLLYAALTHYLETHPHIKQVSILETGTARGFSSVCMAKALDDTARSGRILTIDVLPATKPIFWNCIHDVDGKQTRLQLLEQWQPLVENYIVFIQGFAALVMAQLGLHRVHFAFLDGEHTYDALSRELAYVAAHQKHGDMIVCDDYTPQQFPGVVQAVDEFLKNNPYTSTIFETPKGRAYMVCQRNQSSDLA